MRIRRIRHMGRMGKVIAARMTLPGEGSAREKRQGTAAVQNLAEIRLACVVRGVAAEAIAAQSSLGPSQIPERFMGWCAAGAAENRPGAGLFARGGGCG